ncbi:MAG: tripartite tricarboxylate transporter substrate binding protein [Pseudorhodoplanes sp.]|nr:tripartite tricarboxylate transporter substrate binding protein [Pseudorhodoplanes sp.]
MGALRYVWLAFAGAVAFTSPQANAQTWPAREVKFVVPFTSGTTSDILARAVAEDIAGAIGKPVVVDNQGGAGGNLGAGSVAKADPDGHTILFATTGPAATNKLMYKNLTFDPQKDFEPIVLIGKSPVIIAANPSVPAKSLKELTDYLKANPGKLNAGYPGNGTLGHITGELFQQRAQVKMGGIQYRGSAAIINDLLGGHIDVAMDSMAPYVSNVKEGKLRALAIAGTSRWPGLPDVPTVAESGLPGFEASVWYALLAPAGTPPDVVAKLNAAANAFLKTSKAKDLFSKLGVQSAGGTPADLKKFVADEIEKWSPIVKAANISF